VDITKILENLSSLRFFNGDEDTFWSEYLENISLITKSPLAVLISNDEKNWKLEKKHIQDDIVNASLEEIVKVSTEVSQRAFDKIYAYERFKDKSKNISNHNIVSIQLEQKNREKNYFIVLLIDNQNKLEFSNIVLRASLCRDIFLNYDILRQKKFDISPIVNNIDKSDEQNETNEDFEQILLLLNSILYEKDFKLASMKIADEFANRFNCNKVSIGWESNDYIYPVAINQVEHFNKATSAIKSLEAIFEESYEQDEEIFYPEDENSNLITHAHKTYKLDNRLSALYSFPIRVEDKVVGVVSFEKDESDIDYRELEIIRLSLNYIAPTMNKIYENDRNIFLKFIDFAKSSIANIVGPKNTLKKFLILVATSVLFWVVFGTMEYRVETVAQLQTKNISYISAPFDGTIEQVDIDIGDEIKKHQSLLKFDTQELSLKKLEVISEIVKYNAEIEKARSKRALADMKISIAKKEQSQTSLKKINYFLSLAKITAPFDGIVVEGSKEKLLGSPFAKGDIVLQIANPTGLFATLKVLEEYIDEIRVGQKAQLNLLSRPDLVFNVEIEKIIPMANVDDVNGNIFMLKVKFLDKVENWMRPGMSGIAKVQIEDRSILWILTHKISDYLDMNIWW